MYLTLNPRFTPTLNVIKLPTSEVLEVIILTRGYSVNDSELLTYSQYRIFESKLKSRKLDLRRIVMYKTHVFK